MLIKNYRISMRGFSLIELIMVIAIIGILSVMVMPSFTPPGLTLEYEARRVLNDIRYTQALSMLTGTRYRWVKLSASAYQIVNESGSAILLPNGSTQVVLSSGITFGSFSNLPGNLIAFDTQGVPYITSVLPGSPLSATATIALISGSQTRTIQISAQTGFGVLT